ncbi:MAG TPA: hypothetical protein PKY22_09355 [Accumulibacter sp.]|nr:hypothetical protein [Accumulibacter sp.]
MADFPVNSRLAGQHPSCSAPAEAVLLQALHANRFSRECSTGIRLTRPAERNLLSLPANRQNSDEKSTDITLQILGKAGQIAGSLSDRSHRLTIFFGHLRDVFDTFSVLAEPSILAS